MLRLRWPYALPLGWGTLACSPQFTSPRLGDRLRQGMAVSISIAEFSLPLHSNALPLMFENADGMQIYKRHPYRHKIHNLIRRNSLLATHALIVRMMSMSNRG